MPPTQFRVREVADDFCNRLISDCEGPDAFRKRLNTNSDQKPIMKATGLTRRLFAGRHTVLGQNNIGQPAERYIKETLIWPLLDALDYDYRIEAYLGNTDNRCDFLPVNTNVKIIGECKSPNKYTKAVTDIEQGVQLDGVNAEFGFAVDGFNWQLIHTERQTTTVLTEMDIRSLIASSMQRKGMHNAHNPIRRVAADSTVDIHSPYVGETDATLVAEEFVERFERQNITDTIQSVLD